MFALFIIRFYHFQLQNDIVPIPKSSNPERLKENLDIFDFELSPEDFEKVKALNKSQRSAAFSEWEINIMLFFTGGLFKKRMTNYAICHAELTIVVHKTNCTSQNCLDDVVHQSGKIFNCKKVFYICFEFFLSNFEFCTTREKVANPAAKHQFMGCAEPRWKGYHTKCK